MKKSLGPQTLIFPCPVFLVGTYDENEKPNLATVAWGGICNSDPPSLAVSLREPRYSHRSIIDRQAFTVNIPSAALAREADYAGLVSGRHHDKFQEIALTPVKSDLVDAPYVAECPVICECRLSHTVELGSHTLFIGEVLDVKTDELALDGDGQKVDIYKADPLLFNVGGTYHKVGELVGKAFNIGKELKQA